MVSLNWSHNITLHMVYLLLPRCKEKHCMERSTCFTMVADGFEWFAVLAVFFILPALQKAIPDKKEKLVMELGTYFFWKTP